MTRKKFNLYNKLSAALVFVISAVTYLLTIEPTASFWDCGEFIASSYKLEVGHPPGNPVFQIVARLFTLFGDNMHAAVLVNSMSAICSALTILLLYLTIVWFVKRLFKSGPSGKYSDGEALAIIGSGLVGSLAYCFSDTFWFSAVEGEVYAMSSLFTALVFWAMTNWYDQADEAHSSRWIVLIAFLMGLSIGVHLLNLLAIPALVFMYYYRKHENEPMTLGVFFKVFGTGVLILAVILFAIIPLLPKIAAYFDLFFVNVLHLPYNSGAVFFMVLLLALCFRGIFITQRREKPFLNTVLLCLTTIIIGFSIFSMDIIRSCAKTPTNEYQPDNAFTLVRYLSREQYGSTPIVYGQYFDAPWDLRKTQYWAPLDGRYSKVEGPVEADYKPAGKMLFPRMWSSAGDGRYENFYQFYTKGEGKTVPGSRYKKPTQAANIHYFLDYQLGWMYLRYFMWNFVGRQNEIHSPSPGNIFFGNWESGIAVIDNIRLGDQSGAPDCLKNNRGKNHYFFLPLLLGLLGLCFQYGRDRRGCWLNFLMFFMTGIAIVIYLNQPPYQVRERDYAYAGSFYFFSVWIGLAVAAVVNGVSSLTKGRGLTAVSATVTLLCLCVPVLMAAQNWDDHDRSNRATAPELARNYLESVGANGILVTHGDNDTFPLWYVQEVENVRTDIRICNTSLLGTDWHIDQMKWAVNESAPLRLAVDHKQYLYGVNEYVPIMDTRDTVMDIRDVMAVFRHPRLKAQMSSGREVDYIPSRKISVPVNRENVIASGILDVRYADIIPESIVLTIPSSKEYLTKPEIFILDLLSQYNWDRPINFLNMGGDLNVGIREYLEYQGYSYKLVPVKTGTSSSRSGFTETDRLYSLLSGTFRWDKLSRDDYFIDYQNLFTNLGVMSARSLFLVSANAFIDAGEKERALEMLDKCCEVMANYPLETVPIGFAGNDYTVMEIIRDYFVLGQGEKGLAIAERLGGELLDAVAFYIDFYEFGKDEFEKCVSCIYYLEDILKDAGQAEAAGELTKKLETVVKTKA